MDHQNQAFHIISKEWKRLNNQRERENSDLSKYSDTNEQEMSQTTSQTYPGVIPSLESNNTKFDAPSLYAIDDNIQKMRLELTKSCQLFEAAGEAFESINFNSLKHRVRDLHLSASHSEIDAIMKENESGQRLDKLTNIMGYKFRQHPGEFGDIPELSCFFKACSQLQHGLEELKQQRSEMDGLKKQMVCATNASRQKAEEIQKMLNK